MLLERLNVPDDDPGAQSATGDSQEHLIFMLRTIMGWDRTEKAHRWLGYAQCLGVCLGLWSLEDMKTVNYES